jgi:2-iminobutanoate/2-iminopropanoate deaminase
MTIAPVIKPITTELPRSKAPLEGAVSANGILFTSQIPIDASGQVVAGGDCGLCGGRLS